MNINFLKIAIATTAIVVTQVMAHHPTHPSTGYDMPVIDYLDYRYRSMERPEWHKSEWVDISAGIPKNNPCNYTNFYLSYSNGSRIGNIASVCNTMMMKERPIKYKRKR